MFFSNGNKILALQAIVLLIMLNLPERTFCQRSILDSTFTFRSGTVKTGNALDIITRRTGFNFTYDSRLIDPEKKAEMTFSDTKLRVVLDSILKNDSIVFTVIDKYIIISRTFKPSPAMEDSTSAGKPKFITGLIVDDETNEPLPFATIGLKKSGRGTVSNNNGEFGLNIPPDSRIDTLSGQFRSGVSRRT